MRTGRKLGIFGAVLALTFIIFGCQNISNGENPAASNGDTVYITVADSSVVARTVNPDVTVDDFTKMSLIAAKDGYEQTVFSDKTFGDIKNTKYELERGAGEYTFVLSGTINEMTYSQTLCKKSVKSGINTLEFTLNLEKSGEIIEGDGVVYVAVSLTGENSAGVNAVTATLATDADDGTYETKNISATAGKYIYENKSVPVGSYNLIFSFYGDEAKNHLLGQYKELVNVSKDLVSSAERTIEENLDSICSIDYVLNGGTFGVGSVVPSSYTRLNGVELPVPKRTCFIFDGWCEKEDLSDDAVYCYEPGMKNSSITLYAKWAISAASVSSTIKSLPADGAAHTIALAGLITKDVITMIRDTLAENPDIKVNLDLGATTGLTEIPDNAFYFYNEDDNTEIKCPNLVGIVLPKNITSIGSYAFGYTGISEVVIPDSVTKIGEGAFSSTKLTQVIIPNSVTEIGEFAFCNSSISKINIPDSVTEIGKYAFSGTDISEVVIPSSITKIENGVFQETKLKKIIIPDSVTEIGSYAFCLCTGLESIVIGKGIGIIGTQAFIRCGSLAKVTVPGNVKTIGNGAFSSCENLEEVVLEEGVQTIGNMAFYGCKKLATVTIPKSIASIGSDAFYNCSGVIRVNYNGTKREWAALLSSGKIGASNKNLTNGPIYCTDGVLYSASAIPDVIKSVPADGDTHTLEFAGPFPTDTYNTYSNIKAAFEANSSARICLDMTLTTGMNIDAYQFKDYSSSFVGFVLPEDCTKIEDSVFEDCKGLESFVISNKITTIGSAAFYGCSSLKSIVIPDSVTEIGSYAFYGSGLESVVIGKGIETLGDCVFSSCNSLAKITVPGNVKTVGNMAFYLCNNLEEIVLEEGVEYINESSFSGCQNLKTVTIPKTVQKIEINAFNNCMGITGITYGGTKAEWKAFIADAQKFGRYNECLTNVSIKCSDGTITNIPDIIKNLPEGTYTVTVTGEITEEDLKNIVKAILSNENANVILDMTSATGLTRIPDNMSQGADNLVGIMLPQGVTSIGENAFSRSGLSEIVMPDSLAEIGDYAFYECTGLTSVIIPDGVTTIGKEAFMNCSSLKTMTIPASVATIGDNAVSSNGTGTIQGFEVTYKGTIAQWKTLREEFTSDSKSNYTLSKAIVRCTDGVFCTADNAPSVISALAEGAHTVAVTDDTIMEPDYTATGEAIRSNSTAKIILDMSATSFPSGIAQTFQNCTNLAGIVLSDSRESIGKSEFAGCTGLTSISIPENVTQINDSAFTGCTELVSVSIPSSVTDIGENAFEDCAKLTSVSIPEKVTSIQTQIFKGCTALESVSIPEGIKNIWDEAFANCTSLKEITIPSQPELLKESAFDGCTSLQTVTYGRDGLVLDCGGDTEGYIVSSKIAYLISYLGNDGCTVKFKGTADGTTVKCISAGLKKNTTGAKFNIDITGLADLTDIPALAFWKCTALESIALPATVTSIGQSAFEDCTPLATVYYAGTKAEWEAVTIGTDNAPLSSATIRCSDGDITPSGN